ncbi:hypothetical protein BLA29_002289 [Euroglyphus maynei]|uniref:Uncharacterized protein n=1 Tax=Euroglyphus maynei TaxID=6958 RepID=A0A1Y3BGI4_EURMA|nr:hypothetical protein BLA29_002289 [Euroglyphus maynei]
MSSLLLSQSIISSTENSLREKSLQQQRKIHQHQRHHLHPNHIGGPYNRNFSVGKNDSYQYNNRPQLVVTENELYNSIVGEKSNMLLLAQLPQYDSKLLLTKNLYVFESKQTELLMNLASKPVSLQNRYPALFWSEDFRSIVINEHITGAIWLNDMGDLIFVFMAPLNETAMSILRFQPAINHIQTEIQVIDPNESIIPISSVDPGMELRLVQRKNATSLRVLTNQDDLDRFLCLQSVNETIRRIDLREQICPNSSMQWPHFNIGYGNGTSLHLFADQKQQVLIVPENVLYRMGVEYHFEFIEISQLISNRLFPLIGDWIIVGVASSILFIMIVLVLKYMMTKRHRTISEDSSSRQSSSRGTDESHPLLHHDRRSNRIDEERTEWTSIFCWCKQGQSGRRSPSNNSATSIRSSDRRNTEPTQMGKNYAKI